MSKIYKKISPVMPASIQAAAYADTEIEAEILVRTLKRKKKFKIVRNPKDFEQNIWEKFAVALSEISRS